MISNKNSFVNSWYRMICDELIKIDKIEFVTRFCEERWCDGVIARGWMGNRILLFSVWPKASETPTTY